jgi:predicted dehydrogenase
VLGAFIDLDEAIAQTGADVVAISTPPVTHHALALKALQHGCHILCEKPFAASVNEAEKMLQAATRAGIVHMVGHEFRFVPLRAAIARALNSGIVGEPRLFAVILFNSYVAHFAQNLPAWWFDPGAEGGWLGASGSHVIDQVRTELGEIVSVSAVLPQVATGNAKVEDSFVIRMSLANGAEGTVQQTGGAFGPPAELYRVAGSRGSLWSDSGQIHVATQEATQDIVPGAEFALPTPRQGTDPRQQTAEWQRLAAVELAPYTQLCLHLRAAIERGDLHRDPLAPQPLSMAWQVCGCSRQFVGLHWRGGRSCPWCLGAGPFLLKEDDGAIDHPTFHHDHCSRHQTNSE